MPGARHDGWRSSLDATRAGGRKRALAASLDEMGLEIEREELIRHHYVRPFDHFGAPDVTGDLDDAAGAYGR